jgi:acetamidase/formamidase
MADRKIADIAGLGARSPARRGAGLKRRSSARHSEGAPRRRDREPCCRNAVLNMMERLQERGFSREQAYVICFVAVDLRISNVVDVPNNVVSALLPKAIFDGD